MYTAKLYELSEDRTMAALIAEFDLGEVAKEHVFLVQQVGKNQVKTKFVLHELQGNEATYYQEGINEFNNNQK